MGSRRGLALLVVGGHLVAETAWAHVGPDLVDVVGALQVQCGRIELVNAFPPLVADPPR
jgi:hypothetical protein